MSCYNVLDSNVIFSENISTSEVIISNFIGNVIKRILLSVMVILHEIMKFIKLVGGSFN